MCSSTILYKGKCAAAQLNTMAFCVAAQIYKRANVQQGISIIGQMRSSAILSKGKCAAAQFYVSKYVAAYLKKSKCFAAQLYIRPHV